uniref:Uncharacterized protein n=1 Tax=Mycena chlorophos TaxID=658473 RepID=A0ABQ0LGA8_MYCCL|nr:predicted protein [Mycena chlorophos]
MRPFFDPPLLPRPSRPHWRNQPTAIDTESTRRANRDRVEAKLDREAKLAGVLGVEKPTMAQNRLFKSMLRARQDSACKFFVRRVKTVILEAYERSYIRQDFALRAIEHPDGYVDWPWVERRRAFAAASLASCYTNDTAARTLPA